MTDGLEAAREKEVAVAAWTYALNHMPVDDGFFEEIMDKAFKSGVEWSEARTSESALRAAAQEALRLVKQARHKLFDQSNCAHPDAPDLVAFEEVSSGCDRCQDLLWGEQTGTGTIEPADNLNSSLYDAERTLEAALDGAPWEPSEEQVERATVAINTVHVSHGRHDPYTEARAALKAAMGIESQGAG